MTSNLYAVTFDANDPERLARFWAGLLGWEMMPDDDGFELVPSDGTAYRVNFYPSQEPKRGQNQMHFDLTSVSPEEQQQTVERALELGAQHIDIGQTPDEGQVVLADPEGNEFCVIEAGNNFLADTAFIGAINCDGTQAVGYFWSKALGWPLVWDQDEETAIQSPSGARRSPGVGRRWHPRPARTGCTSTSPLRPAKISRPRSSVSSRSARSASTSVKATSAGRSWPIPTATSSAC